MLITVIFDEIKFEICSLFYLDINQTNEDVTDVHI